MYASEIARAARHLNIENFIGVFPLDRLPASQLTRAPRPCSFIVNTDTSNLPGKHWIAVSCSGSGIVHAFDPLGQCYPFLLCRFLAKQGRTRRVLFNRVMYQNPRLRTCGQHCLRWLKYKQGMCLRVCNNEFVDKHMLSDLLLYYFSD